LDIAHCHCFRHFLSRVYRRAPTCIALFHLFDAVFFVQFVGRKDHAVHHVRLLAAAVPIGRIDGGLLFD
jgi:hypothetical protein